VAAAGMLTAGLELPGTTELLDGLQGEQLELAVSKTKPVVDP
jgi:hypothetical protein